MPNHALPDDLIEDMDGAPLPAELQRDGAIWRAIRSAAMIQPSGFTADDIADAACIELAPILWPLLPSNDHHAALDAIHQVPRRSGAPEWSAAREIAQAVGFDMGLATASDAVRSGLSRVWAS